MPVYSYRAKKGPYEFIEGQIEASNKQEAITKIDSLGLFLFSIKEKNSSSKISHKVSLKELAEFTHQLSTLINSEFPLLSSLTTLFSETEQVHLKPVIADIISRIKEGELFSQSLRRYPHIFSELYISLVAVGEASGTLGESLERIVTFLEEERDFRANIISILIYPGLVVCMGIATVVVLSKFVIPKLVEVFEGLGQTLPVITVFLIEGQRFISTYGIFIFGFIVLLFFAARRHFIKPPNRLRWDEFKLRLPFVGGLLKKIEVCRLSRTFSILLRQSVPIDSSLRVLAYSCGNVFFKEQIAAMERIVKEGESLSVAMKQVELFVPSFINVVTVGEESGTLDRVLENLSNDYHKVINRKMKALVSILEPLLILSVGLVFGFVVLSILLPVFQMDFSF